LVSLPMAMIVLALSLNNFRLLLIPLACLPCGLIFSFGLLGLAAQAGLLVSTATAPLMYATLMAISIDYALFLLTRFKEEIEANVEVTAAVEAMLTYSGHTVCGSGLTLMFCFFALLFFPVQVLQSIGLGVILSILAAIIVSMSLLPACLLAWPKFFSNFTKCGCDRDNSRSLVPSGTSGMHRTHSDLGAPVPPAGKTTFWDRWGIMATSNGAALVTGSLLLVVGALALIEFGHLRKSLDIFLWEPRSSVTTATMHRFGQSFTMGAIAPYRLLLTPSNGTQKSMKGDLAPIYDATFWNSSQNMLADITASFAPSSKTTGVVASVMYGFHVLGRQDEKALDRATVAMVDPFLLNRAEFCGEFQNIIMQDVCEVFVKTKVCSDLPDIITQRMLMFPEHELNSFVEDCTLLQGVLEATVSRSRDALYALLVPSELVASDEAVRWTRTCRDVIAQDYPGVTPHLVGTTADMMDAIDAIYQRVPLIIMVTVSLCLILVSLLTKSLAFGVSSVVLISWTVVLVFSIGALVYQHGIFGASAPAPLAESGGLAWIVLPLTGTVILGLGLDYDLFLLGRVCEGRMMGLSDRDAIAVGVSKTGPVITSAGIIMAVAYSGLLMSDIPILNQTSLLLVAAVLIDTFFIRALATPAVHAPLGKLNWWPRKVPEPSVEMAGLSEHETVADSEEESEANSDDAQGMDGRLL